MRIGYASLDWPETCSRPQRLSVRSFFARPLPACECYILKPISMQIGTNLHPGPGRATVNVRGQPVRRSKVTHLIVSDIYSHTIPQPQELQHRPISDWASRHNLKLNQTKSTEMILNLQRTSASNLSFQNLVFNGSTVCLKKTGPLKLI